MDSWNESEKKNMYKSRENENSVYEADDKYNRNLSILTYWNILEKSNGNWMLIECNLRKYHSLISLQICLLVYHSIFHIVYVFNFDGYFYFSSTDSTCKVEHF